MCLSLEPLTNSKEDQTNFPHLLIFRAECLPADQHPDTPLQGFWKTALEHIQLN